MGFDNEQLALAHVEFDPKDCSTWSWADTLVVIMRVTASFPLIPREDSLGLKSAYQPFCNSYLCHAGTRVHLALKSQPFTASPNYFEHLSE